MRRTVQGQSTGQQSPDARTIRHDARTTLRANLEPDARTSRVTVYNVNRDRLLPAAVTVPLVPFIADPEVQEDETDSDDPYYDVFAPSRVAARVSRPSISPSSTGLPDMGVRVLSGGAGGVAGSYSASHMGIPVSMMPPGNPMLMDADEYETWFGKCLSAAARISASTRLQTTSSPGPPSPSILSVTAINNSVVCTSVFEPCSCHLGDFCQAPKCVLPQSSPPSSPHPKKKLVFNDVSTNTDTVSNGGFPGNSPSTQVATSSSVGILSVTELSDDTYVQSGAPSTIAYSDADSDFDSD